MDNNIFSSFKTDLYSDYAYNMFNFWKYIIMYAKYGSSIFTFRAYNYKTIHTFFLKRELDGNITINLIDGSSRNDTSYFIKYGGCDSLISVFNRIGNVMKHKHDDLYDGSPFPSWLSNFRNNIKYEFSFTNFSTKKENGYLTIKPFIKMSSYYHYNTKNCSFLGDDNMDDNDLIFNLTEEIDFNTDKDFVIRDYNFSKEKLNFFFGYFKKLFDILECQNENNIYRISILDAMFVNIFDYFCWSNYKYRYLTPTFENISEIIEKNDYLTETLQTIKFAKSLTWGEYRNFCKFLLNRKSLEKKNPEFVKKLIGSQRDPITIEFAKNSIDETKNAMMEMLDKFNKTENELKLKFNEFKDQVRNIVSNYRTEYNKQKNEIEKFMSDMVKMNPFDIFTKETFISSINLLSPDKNFDEILSRFNLIEIARYTDNSKQDFETKMEKIKT